MNSHNPKSFRLHDSFPVWSESWSLVNGVLFCVMCGTCQKPSEAHRPFVHVDHCVLRQDFAQWPWRALIEFLGELPAVPGRFVSQRLEAGAVLAPLNLPAALHARACKLLHAIGCARTRIDLRQAADRAEGFALGLETLRALNPGNVEGLYLAFDHAEQVRQAELGG